MRKPILYDKVQDYCFGLINQGYSIEQIENALLPIAHILANSTRYYLLESCKTQRNLGLSQFTRKFPNFILTDALERKFYPKPAYLEDENLHPSVKRFFEAMYAKLPEYPFHLNLPCTDKALALLEERFETPMPKAFSDFYKITDGLCMPIIQDFGSIEQILAVSQYWRESVYDDEGYWKNNNYQEYYVTPEDIIQPYYYHKNWLIFCCTEGTGDFYAIDFVPGAKGTLGQIIESGANLGQGFLRCESFETMLDKLTERVLKNDLVISTLTYPFIDENWWCSLPQNDWTLGFSEEEWGDLYYLHVVLSDEPNQ